MVRKDGVTFYLPLKKRLISRNFHNSDRKIIFRRVATKIQNKRTIRGVGVAVSFPPSQVERWEFLLRKCERMAFSRIRRMIEKIVQAILE